MLYGTTAAGGQAGQGTLFRVNQDGLGFQLLKTFGPGTNDGLRPFAGLLEGKDGLLYGTTEEGGDFGFGTVFQLKKDGSAFTILKSFAGTSDGAYPEAGLIEGSDGLLYGTASGGGTNDSGVVFSLRKDGANFTTLVQFFGTNGANPESELLEATDGRLYGTTCSGDSTNPGTVFRVEKDGTGFTNLVHFLNTSTIKTNGASPQARLIEGTNGMLYGTTPAGGTNTTGTIYALSKDGSGFASIYHFGARSTNDGRIPLGELLLGSDGMLYGTTFDGGTNGNGTVFSLDHDGSNYHVIASLVSPQGAASGLIEGTNGLLYCTSQLGGDTGAGTVFALAKDGSGFNILKSFSPSGGDGQGPQAAPIKTSQNELAGTARIGGTLGKGTVYHIRFDGAAYSVVSSLAEVANPIGALLEATNGNFYGVTQFGGTSNNGAVFSLGAQGGNFGTVYSPDNATNGREFRASLIQASDGTVYGTTASGGSGGEGIAFRLNQDGSGFTILKNFASGSTGPGANPLQPLMEASDRRLYGKTYFGGVTNRGIVFSMSKDGTSYTVLKSFGTPASDGESPMSPLLEASDGFLYGSTYGGGLTNNAGTVFRLNKDGTGFHVILSFTALGSDGRHPCGALVEWLNGSLYGTTEYGGTAGQGTIFKVNKDGTGYSVVASFEAATGSRPRGGLVEGPDGALYGTTEQGGQMGLGTVFRYGTAFGDITSIEILNQVPTVTGVGQPGTNFVLEYSATLGPLATWSTLGSTNAPANGQFSFLDSPASAEQRFYRLKH
jgi:uncharacterized repeat protein (TIGR03803 family)